MIAFLNHYQPRCGVYQMGHRIGATLESLIPEVRLYEGDFDGAKRFVDALQPRIVVYNWHPYTLPWSQEMIRRLPRAKHVGLIHEIAESSAHAGSDIFPYRMVCDPTFPANNQSVFRSVRHVPRYEKPPPENDRFTVGSFGFAVGGKLYHHVVPLVCDSFARPLIRLRIPFAFYGDDAGAAALSYARDCAKELRNDGELQVEHDFLSEDALLDWLAANDLNVFFYEPNVGRGIASAIDYAVAVRRPLAVNGSDMFRHVRHRLGHYPSQSLMHLAFNQKLVEELYAEWSPERLARDYQQMFNALG